MKYNESDLSFNGHVVPFTAMGDAGDCNLNKGRRVRIVREFILQMGGLDDIPERSLDIGPPNAFGKALGIRDNTSGDVNEGVYPPSSSRSNCYDLIFFSEIIEHLMNPLRPLQDCFYYLRRGGILVVSTPIPNVIFYQSKHHLTEYRPDRLRQVFSYVGFEIVGYKKISIWDKKFMFYGVRPFLRVLFHRSQLWMLRKP